MPSNPPSRARTVYNAVGRDSVSIIDQAFESHPGLRDELAAAGLLSNVHSFANDACHQAQIVAIADVLEYLMPILESGLEGHHDLLRDLEGLRLDLVRERLAFTNQNRDAASEE